MTIFYKKDIESGSNTLPEEESKHCALVLRHKVGDNIRIFDGKGAVYESKLTLISKKVCEFEIIDKKKEQPKDFKIHLAIAPTKNMDRMEWLIEKLSEIGVDEVSFIQTQHSERKKMRFDRLEKKAISAMKQSGNPFLIQINEIVTLEDFLSNCDEEQRFIAHVDETHTYVSGLVKPKHPICILIGPEGDFSPFEVDSAKSSGFKPVSLGHNTLRTETAGFVACCIINSINKY
ncbi:16S rRNA (uracil(1498)-N(3))-methyltransferase [Ekhidna sp.]|uniref:16S rRNA (uracil(1498)-N(3))-methyltransferase n=1 Tax=Ekhidna sp. TaxID=2608089 RepID=UPI003CCBF331